MFFFGELYLQSRDHGTNLASFYTPLYILLRVMVQGSVSIQKKTQQKYGI